MCSSGDATAKSAEKNSLVLQELFKSAFSTTFGKNQAILDNLTKTLTDRLNNPRGFSPEQLALLKTSATENVQNQTEAAKVGAGNYIASHGGADLGSGVAAQITGSIEGTGASDIAKETTGIDLASEQQKYADYWNSIKGLSDVAAAENPAGYAGAANTAGDVTANLSHAVLASEQAGWQNAFGVVGGIAGLGTAAVGGLKSAGVFGGSTTGTGATG